MQGLRSICPSTLERIEEQDRGWGSVPPGTPQLLADTEVETTAGSAKADIDREQVLCMILL